MNKALYQPSDWHYLIGDFLNRVRLRFRKAISVLLGAVNGFFIVYRKLPAFIVTLAMMIARGFAYLWSGGRPMSISNPVLVAIKKNEFLGLSPPMYGFLPSFL